jgi:hypothetical protein
MAGHGHHQASPSLPRSTPPLPPSPYKSPTRALIRPFLHPLSLAPLTLTFCHRCRCWSSAVVLLLAVLITIAIGEASQSSLFFLCCVRLGLKTEGFYPVSFQLFFYIMILFLFLLNFENSSDSINLMSFFIIL